MWDHSPLISHCSLGAASGRVYNEKSDIIWIRKFLLRNSTNHEREKEKGKTIRLTLLTISHNVEKY